VSELMRAFSQWIESEDPDSDAKRQANFPGYMHGISQARYVVRKVFRIVDEQAKKAGLDPLQHLALIHIYGTSDAEIPVNQVAERLDIAPAFASRLVKALEARGLVRREQSSADRRMAYVVATEAGVQLLRDVDSGVRAHVNYFQSQLDDDGRLAALAIFAFYVGIEAEPKLARAIRDSIRTRVK
jgi:DNA-binding MarR family transcriptional regulator